MIGISKISIFKREILVVISGQKEKPRSSSLIDLNTLTYVAIHELAHIATESVGHTPEFWKNFKFLLNIAKEINIYEPINYKKNPKQYCGMDITDNPYFDT